MGRRSFFFSKLPTTTTVTRTWSSGGNINSSELTNAPIVLGTMTDCLNAGGYSGTSGGSRSGGEIYNGTSWSSINDLPNNKNNSPGACGSTSAGVCINGSGPDTYNSTQHLEYDGTDWSTNTATNRDSRGNAAAGTLNDCFTAGGISDDADSGKYTQKWNGSSWSGSGLLPVGLTWNPCCGGSSSDAILAGCNGDTNGTYLYNGTTWSKDNDLNTTYSYNQGGDRGGSSSYHMIAGAGLAGSTKNNCETYNGTTWSVANTLNDSRGAGGGTGSGGDAITVSGQDGGVTCEEFA